MRFVSTRNFSSCFEYRTDGDESQSTGNNFNPNAHGLYPYVCVNNSKAEQTIQADEYVEVRMVFVAESDERLDWTRFDVIPLPTNKDQFKNCGRMDHGFKNQGHCVSFVMANENAGKTL